jgi:hypothetical protein
MLTELGIVHICILIVIIFILNAGTGFWLFFFLVGMRLLGDQRNRFIKGMPSPLSCTKIFLVS